ncbi:MAG: M15 family metallopeptidase [bacterium]|nr:M15 family metallopeptidase [bacterium]
MRKEVVKKRKMVINKGLCLLLIAFVVSAVALIFIIISFFDGEGKEPKKTNFESSSKPVLSSQSSSEQIQSESSTTSDVSNVSNVESSTTSVSAEINYSEPVKTNLADDLDKWNLVLVNPKNELSDGYVPPLTNLKYASRNDAQFDSRAIAALNAMCKDAAKSGVNIYSISAYRSIATQTRLYNNEVAKQKGYGLSDEKARQVAATIVAYPGTSEHNLGLAVDFNSVEETFENTAQFRWLRKNAENYGFVMRYAKEKQNITGIIYEPWHYRYVGIDHAKKMNELNMCLEEYIEYLKKSK